MNNPDPTPFSRLLAKSIGTQLLTTQDRFELMTILRNNFKEDFRAIFDAADSEKMKNAGKPIDFMKNYDYRRVEYYLLANRLLREYNLDWYEADVQSARTVVFVNILLPRISGFDLSEVGNVARGNCKPIFEFWRHLSSKEDVNIAEHDEAVRIMGRRVSDFDGNWKDDEYRTSRNLLSGHVLQLHLEPMMERVIDGIRE